MSEHPYRSQPDRAFWSRSVSSGFDPTIAFAPQHQLIGRTDRVASVGSCFASNLVPWLEISGVEYVRTERVHPAFAELGENLGYRNFSAAYGNVYTSRQLRQLAERATGLFVPAEDRWYTAGAVVDPFRPGLRYPADDDDEFDLQTERHFAATRAAFDAATVIVVTLGLTEMWMSREDGAAYPGAPGTIAGTFDPQRHVMHELTVDEVVDDLVAFAGIVRETNPAARFIVTVSPVPLVATATTDHVVVASIRSKSVLRIAAERFVEADSASSYFPSYEIIAGPQAPHEYFETDRRSVSPSGVSAVMRTLLGDLLGDNDQTESIALPAATAHRFAAPLAQRWAQRLVAAECDEVLAEG